jgi:peptidoglycan/xylan/chitin deacetylase (PgdA/CDA1 family)
MMALRSQLGKAREFVLTSLHRRPVAKTIAGPVVSFCFDDFPRTAFRTGGSILAALGARGTYYAALGLMNSQNDLGEQFTAEDLDSLLAGGHELASHTFYHSSCRKLPLTAFERDVEKGKFAISEMTGFTPSNFAYPYGHVTTSAKKRIGMRMRSCRGIYSGANGPTADLNLLRANSLYGDVDQLPRVESLLNKNANTQNWVIFYTHDVRSNPSPFGCTPQLLERAISAALAFGFRISTVDQALTGQPEPGPESGLISKSVMAVANATRIDVGARR